MTASQPYTDSFAARQAHLDVTRVGVSGALFLTGLFLRLVLSNGLLDQFIPYSRSGGSYAFKIHIGTMLIFMAYFVQPKFGPLIPEFKPIRIMGLLFGCALGFITFTLVLRFGLSSIAYLIDTFFCAIVASLYIISARRHVAHQAFRMVCAIVCVNSVIAVAEFLIQRHFLPDPGFHFTFFRSFSIFGHPLLNALMTGAVALFVLNNKSLGRATLPFFCIAAVAILAFGARAALGMLIVIGLGKHLLSFWSRLVHGKVRRLEMLTLPLGMLFVIASGYFLLFETSFGARFLAKSDLSGASSGARLNVLTIYDSLTRSEFLFGISASTKGMLIEQNPYFTTIENFWIDMSLSFGLVGSIAVFSTLIGFFMAVIKSDRLLCGTAGLFFMIVASSNNALSIKSPALLVFVVFLLAARRMTAGSTPKD